MTASSMQEIEAKFGLTHARYTAALAGAPHLGRDFLLTPVTLVTQLDLYLDTADYALVRGGHALRLRHSAGKVQAGLKNLTLVGKNHWHQRLELEAFLPDPADPLDWSKWPAVLHDFLSTQLPEREPLHPFFLLQQNRQKRLVHTRARPGEAAVAELSIDEVQVYALDSLPQGEDWSAVLKASEPLASFWTLEAELLEGQDEAQLAAIVEKLEHKRGLRPVHDSKFEQALRIIHHHLLVGDEHIEHWTPTLSIADGCRLVWREQLAQLLLNEAGVRYSDESEYVHDMRVAVRRMRTALRLFASYFRRKRLDRFGRALQALGQRLGALRDHDVALARLEKSREPSGQSDSHAGIESNWLRARNTLYRELLDWLDSEEYRRFLVEFSAFCAQAGKGARKFKVKPGERPLPYQVCHVLPA
nr:CHAD domain-containing protein [Caldilineaceae bacterium]